MDLIISEHATYEMARRGIGIQDVERVFKAPQQIIPAKFGRQVYQSIIEIDAKPYLLRLIIDEGLLITAYRTSKIQKYWRQG